MNSYQWKHEILTVGASHIFSLDANNNYVYKRSGISDNLPQGVDEKLLPSGCGKMEEIHAGYNGNVFGIAGNGILFYACIGMYVGIGIGSYRLAHWKKLSLVIDTLITQQVGSIKSGPDLLDGSCYLIEVVI